MPQFGHAESGRQRPARRNAVHDHVQEGADREPEQGDEGQQQDHGAWLAPLAWNAAGTVATWVTP